MDPLEQILDETRRRFVETFPAQCEVLGELVDQGSAAGGEAPLAELARLSHRLTGLAGTIGFPTISLHAAALEQLASQRGGAFAAASARETIAAIRAAYAADVAAPPVWARFAQPIAAGDTILIAEDDAEQRGIVSACLQQAGYTVHSVAAGDLVVAAARAEQPAAILLDIAMPGLDGYAVCQQLKTDPALAPIPVIFMTGRSSVDDRVAGLMLGADEFLTKPIDMRELVLRIQLVLKRGRAGAPAAPAAATAVRTVIVAEDDPDVTRIVDAQLRAAGYQTVVAFDGEQALAAVRTHGADVMVLDLLMAVLSGFDVLEALRASGSATVRVIVLSGRGREEDVMRAFELGAADYMTKPFNPQELMARIERLLRTSPSAVRSEPDAESR